MKAICVTPDRSLTVRDVPAPREPAAGHVLVNMRACAINHGDKTFLARPDAMGRALATDPYDVWGASGAGTVVATGAGVSGDLVGKRVAVYRSLRRSAVSIGLWCECAQVPVECCLLLPPDVRAEDYSGSLVNIVTAFAFLQDGRTKDRSGVIATAGRSATAIALAGLARHDEKPVILLVRGTEASAIPGLETITLLPVDAIDFTERLAAATAGWGAGAAVFDGVGGALLSRLLPTLPMRSTVSCYGFLGGTAPVSFPTALLMGRDLSLARFSNFDSDTVTDAGRLSEAQGRLAAVIADPLFRTRIGRTFPPEQIEEAMRHEDVPGAKAVLLFGT